MASEAIRRYPGDEVHATASATQSPGDIVQAGGLAGVVASLSEVASGDPMTVMIKGVYDVAAASGTTFSEGAEVEWDDTNKLAVAATAGDFDLGVAAKAKTSGQTVVQVILNEGV